MTLADAATVVLLHFQNEIVSPAGAIARMGNAEQVTAGGVIAHAQKLVLHARSAGRPVGNVGSAYSPGYPELNRNAPHFAKAAAAGWQLAGTWGSEFVEPLAPRPGEAVILHAGLGVFGTTGISAVLTQAGTRRVVLCGVSTRLVVEAVTFEAVDRGYAVTVVTDCCAARSPEAHREALDVLRGFATLTTAGQLCAAGTQSTHGEAQV